jgi:multidrug efflux system membrane fusion protein
MADSLEPPPRNLDEAVDALRSPPPRNRSRLWIVIAVLACVAAAAAIYYYTTRTPAEPAADTGAKGKGKGKGGPNAGRPVPILAAPARTADVPVYLTGLGTVTPMASVTLRSRVDGQLLRVLFTEGQFVKAGQLLAEIDPRPFQVQLTQAEGQLAKDQALLRNAVLDLERYRTLFAQDSIAKQQLDTQASLVRQYEAQIKADQGAVESAKLQLSYSRVTAPIAGRIGLRQVDPGNIVRSSDTNGLLVITQLQPVSVIFTIPEDAVSNVMRRLKSGEKLPVEGWDRADKTKLANGTLLTVDNQIDPTTGTVKLRARFSNDDFALFPNQFVNARMLVDTLRGATVVPNAAVQRGNQGTYVYIVKADNTVTVRPVKLGPAQGEIVSVESGVTPGEQVVTDGADRLREGAKVEVADRSPRPDKGAGKGRGGKGKGGDAGAAAAPAANATAPAATQGNAEAGAAREQRGPRAEGAARGERSSPPAEGGARGERSGPPAEGGARAERSGPPAEGGARAERSGPPAEGEARRERRGPPAEGEAPRERRGKGEGEGGGRRKGGDAAAPAPGLQP